MYAHTCIYNDSYACVYMYLQPALRPPRCGDAGPDARHLPSGPCSGPCSRDEQSRAFLHLHTGLLPTILLATYYLLPTIVLPVSERLPTTYYLLLITYYLLYYLLPTTYYLLPNTYCILPTHPLSAAAAARPPPGRPPSPRPWRASWRAAAAAGLAGGGGAGGSICSSSIGNR